MKKTKIIIPALGMLLLSTAASITGTVAWFSMNNFVTATGMSVKAKAENGIVIAATSNSATWNDSATATHNTLLPVYPTSTANGSTWVHSSSNDVAQANTGNAYTLLTIANDSATGAGYVETNSVEGYQAEAGGVDPNEYEAENAYYLLNSFYIKSSAEALNKTIYITHVKATTTTSNSTDLNKSLRVLIKLHDNNASAKIYTPFGGDTSYNVATAAGTYTAQQRTAVTAIDSSANSGLVNTSFLANQDIPAYSSNSPLRIDVFLYFEGEDSDCKSANLAETMDTLQVEVKFGTQVAA